MNIARTWFFTVWGCVAALASFTFAQTVTELATALSAAPHEAARSNLLARHATLLSPELCQELLKRGETLLQQRDLNAAATHYQLILAIAPQMTGATEALKQNWQAQATGKWGTALYQAGQHQAALERQQQSLGFARAASDLPLEVEALRNLAVIHRVMGNFNQSGEYYRQTLAVAERTGDQRQIACALNGLSIHARMIGELESSLRYAEQALARYTAAGDATGAISMQLSLGNTHSALGDFEAALAAYTEGQRRAAALGDEVLENSFISQTGGIYLQQGKYGTAQERFERALAFDRRKGSFINLTNSLDRLGGVYSSQGDHGKALAYFNEVLARRRQSNERPGEAAALIKIGNTLTDLQKYDEAHATLEQALTLAETIKHTVFQAAAWQNLASLHRLAGRNDEALKAHRAAIALAEKAQNAQLMVEANANLAEFYSYAERHTEAKALAEYALALNAKAERAETNWQMHTVIGRAQRAARQFDAARQSFDAAIQIVETLRDNARPNATNRSQFLDNKLAAYREQIGLLIEQREPWPALQYTERAKARALLGILKHEGQPARTAPEKTLTAAEAERERALLRTLGMGIDAARLAATVSRVVGLRNRTRPDRHGRRRHRHELGVVCRGRADRRVEPMAGGRGEYD